MAQKVGYFEDNVVFTEGPFVLVYTHGWRVECELKGHKCPVLPDVSISRFAEMQGHSFKKSDDEEEMTREVDWLNTQVQKGEIVLHGRQWIHPRFYSE